MAALVVATAVVAGCAGGTGEGSLSTTAPAPTEEQPTAVGGARIAGEASTGENQLPAVDVIDVASGQEVDLAGYAPAETPIVLWFWAPH